MPPRNPCDRLSTCPAETFLTFPRVQQLPVSPEGSFHFGRVVCRAYADLPAGSAGVGRPPSRPPSNGTALRSRVVCRAVGCNSSRCAEVPCALASDDPPPVEILSGRGNIVRRLLQLDAPSFSTLTRCRRPSSGCSRAEAAGAQRRSCPSPWTGVMEPLVRFKGVAAAKRNTESTGHDHTVTFFSCPRPPISASRAALVAWPAVKWLRENVSTSTSARGRGDDRESPHDLCR
jgi:hypothetical protein